MLWLFRSWIHVINVDPPGLLWIHLTRRALYIHFTDSESESGSPDHMSPSTPTRELPKIPLPKTIISGKWPQIKTWQQKKEQVKSQGNSIGNLY